MALHPGKKMIPMYVEPSIFREIKVYAAETDQPMQIIVKDLNEKFEQDAIMLVTRIREMKKQAEVKRQKEEEDARIAAENTLKVDCHEVDPVGNLEVVLQTN